MQLCQKTSDKQTFFFEENLKWTLYRTFLFFMFFYYVIKQDFVTRGSFRLKKDFLKLTRIPEGEGVNPSKKVMRNKLIFKLIFSFYSG